MKIMVWHVHGSWTTSFVHGRHDYLVPLTPDRGPDGRGRADTYPWPGSVREVPYDRLAGEDVDVVVYQRPHELRLAREWLGRDVPGAYVEHNTPAGDVPKTRHVLADRDDIPIVHVTHFNDLFWDSGRAPTHVIEHGVVDPGHLYTGELARAGVVVNEPIRRWRVAGTDLLPTFAATAPLDVFGMKVTNLPAKLGLAGEMEAFEDLPQAAMHAELARRRVYLHPYRWTSLGLSLIEAMMIGMPIVALATTEAVEAVPPEAGVVSTKLPTLLRALHRFAAEPELAVQAGKAARSAALARYNLDRFLTDWDRLLGELVPG
ncbi:glycosyltransferase [Microbispora sp. SCL1-1]|uniref:glycosyltransferase n=1 Tax=Microbispora TaxID=2005 RepID=UPI001157818C|nr:MULTISPECIES: glycosyltransferase [unclassified Microbispora]NJP26130.1 glycosyltransferase [Microbispora sp. CL1-1]TQS12565.1 glycosyltransferase [Microbispora sp. SCL1-1]